MTTQQPSPPLFILLGFLFISGFASLVYQVLWMRELTLLFGATSYATAGTLAVFFGGLAIGGAIWSYRAPRAAQPLKEYGMLEIGVGLSGALYFSLMFVYAGVYTPLHEALGDMPALLLIAKMVLAAGVLLPPAILMGGTLPLMSQYVVGASGSLGRVGTLMYGINTLGAASGALAAGFWLPAWLGFYGAYLVAIVASLFIGAVSWVLGSRQPGLAFNTSVQPMRVKSQPTSRHSVSLISPKLIAAAAASGMFALALEVLWTRMFQQVLQNSVYTFSIILVIFLAALSAGAFVAKLFARTGISPWKVLAFLMTLAGIGALATPFLFYNLTDGMRYLGAGEQWSLYLFSVFSGAVLVLFLPGVAVGSVFPYLLRIAERSGEAGKVLGRLSAMNTTGAIVGSLLTGFVLLSAFGLWRSVQLIALMYFLLAVWIAFGNSRLLMAAPVLGLILAITIADPSGFPDVRLKKSENLLASWEGPDGTVSVVERKESLRIKVNNFYALGSSAAMEHEQNQTYIPLMPHPSPEHLFYLGMGTGITAGAGLRLPSKEITVTELIPEVITAGAEYFNEYALGLFTNERARVIARDGRNELRGSAKQYDAILADLFIPWRAGVGNVYSRDHYATARDRLRPGGIYVQWIPLYQVTDIEFWTIARTLLDVFPQVHVWRGDFYVDKPILALVGSVDAEPLSASAIIRNGRHLSGGRPGVNQTTLLAVTLPFYAGNLSESQEIVPKGPIHTDNNPVIDYQAPISHRNARAGKANWFIDKQFIDFLDQLITATPPNIDPYLSRLDPAARKFVLAGFSYHKGAMLEHIGQKEEAQYYLNSFVKLLPMRMDFKTTGEGSSAIEQAE